jgi:two-component system, chemotaxis family, sensor kinase CheA
MFFRDQEFKEIYIAESLESYDSLSLLLTKLEKKPKDEKLLAEIFRLMHNIKANSKSIGFQEIADVAHKLETAFGYIRNQMLEFSQNIKTVLFDGVDLVGAMIRNIDNPEFTGPEPDLLKNLDLILEKHSGANVELTSVKQYYSSQNLNLSELIYIRVKKLDALLNLVGELLIDKDRILSVASEIDHEVLNSACSRLHRLSTDLQNNIMEARLIGINSLFNKFPRIVRDIAIIEHKNINLEVVGHDIQVDRNILQVIADSVLHIVRNAATHGIETEKERRGSKKNPEGKIVLSAHNDKDQIVIKISDDGRGLDIDDVKKKLYKSGKISHERLEKLSPIETFTFLFESGFSLAKKVTEYSGRGVGLDVVKNSIDYLGGKVTFEAEKGKGAVVSLYIPTSITVKGALLFQVGENIYAIPVNNSYKVASVATENIHQIGESLIYDFMNETIPLFLMNSVLNSISEQEIILGNLDDLKGPVQDIVIVSYNDKKLGFLVDKLIRQQDIVIKPLFAPIDKQEPFGGVTLVGTGEICFVIDVPALFKKLGNKAVELVAQ